MTPKLVSVVIPTHNRLELALRAVRSINEQTYREIEIIVVDDASSEDLSPLLRSTRHPITIVRNSTRVGAQRSRLAGARAASGAFVALLDSDDWWDATKVAKQVAACVDSPGALCATRIRLLTATDSVRIVPKRLLRDGEPIEEYWFANGGLLQTSTLMAGKATMLVLLEATEGTAVHNDPSIALEAQRREVPIVQLPEALTVCDGTFRNDRVSMNPDLIGPSIEWFERESRTWSVLAKRGYLFHSRARRYFDAGLRWKGLVTVASSYDPSFSIKALGAYLLEAALGTGAKAVARRLRWVSRAMKSPRRR